MSNYFFENIKDILNNENFQSMKKYMQHGKTSVYTHSLILAYICYKKSLKYKNIDRRSLIRGALLHDYFLYDWHLPRIISKRKGLHGYNHPKVALNNANNDFKLNKKERNIIRSHMWPLTFFHMPLSKEAWLVCKYDKILSIKETRKK